MSLRGGLTPACPGGCPGDRQSPRKPGDCFATLAMTNVGKFYPHFQRWWVITTPIFTIQPSQVNLRKNRGFSCTRHQGIAERKRCVLERGSPSKGMAPPSRFCEKRGGNRLHTPSIIPIHYPTVGIRRYIPRSFDFLLCLNFIMAAFSRGVRLGNAAQHAFGEL